MSRSTRTHECLTAIGIQTSAIRQETLWEIRSEKGHVRFLVTSKPDRSVYYLYEVKDGKPVRVNKAKHPNEL